MKVIDLQQYNDKELQDICIISKLIPESVKPLFEIKEFRWLKYGKVRKLKEMAIEKKGVDYEMIKFVSKLNGVDFDDNKILNSKASSYFRTINIIEENFNKIDEYSKQLISDVDPLLILAGVDVLNKYGDINTIDAIAKYDVLRWKRVLKMDWWDVFIKLKKTKDENEVFKQYEILKSQQNNKPR